MSFHDQVKPHCPNSLVISERDLNKLVFQNPLRTKEPGNESPFVSSLNAVGKVSMTARGSSTTEKSIHTDSFRETVRRDFWA